MTRPALRVIEGGRCPPALRTSVERAMETELLAMGALLQVLLTAAADDLDDEDLASELLEARASIVKARLALARRKI